MTKELIQISKKSLILQMLMLAASVRILTDVTGNEDTTGFLNFLYEQANEKYDKLPIEEIENLIKHHAVAEEPTNEA